ncbi:hypothetical protein J2S19_001396 [Metabacillus malikii]|uniref:Uncharacterized protein n=1 Tax=Metabacillus malikii TaxID=1504265 RepID=A0ABT9ZD23_9BACI|nr:hypothetical protein [Metabacillus malikii]
MNTAEQNEKNLLAMKKIISEVIIALSVAWIGCWFMTNTSLYSISLITSVLFIRVLRYLNMSVKFLYVLSIFTLLIAIFVTIFIE